jgi:uncharacterized protein (PEP-CTERM system associated)
MAITHRKALGALASLLGGSLLTTAAVAQSQTTRIQPTLDLNAQSTDNVNVGAASARKSDVVLSATAGLVVQAVGPNATVAGQYQLKALSYQQGSQPDRVLPSGAISVHTDVLRQGWGIDANLASEQVKANFLSNNGSSTPSTADSYTNTRYGISPYLSRPLDSNTNLTARLGRTWLTSTQNSNSLASRPDSSVDSHRLLLTRRPTRIGYELDAGYQSTKVSGQADPSLTERTGKASLLYAITPELEVGLTGGRERTQMQTRTVRDTIRGGRVQWQPSERTLLKAQFEDRFFGKGWQFDASHRSPWLALGFSSRRSPETYTSSLGTVQAGTSIQSLYDAMLTTRITDPVARKKAVDDLIATRNLPTTMGSTREIYDLGAVLRESTSARLAVMGRRDVLTLSTGMSRSRPLLNDSTSLVLPPPSSKEYFFDSQLNHLLTPASTVSGGLRWSRAQTSSSGLPAARSREFSWLASINTRLSPDATATMGIKHLITHTSTVNSDDETSMFVGLGYRF